MNMNVFYQDCNADNFYWILVNWNYFSLLFNICWDLSSFLYFLNFVLFSIFLHFFAIFTTFCCFVISYIFFIWSFSCFFSPSAILSICHMLIFWCHFAGFIQFCLLSFYVIWISNNFSWHLNFIFHLDFDQF